MGKKSVYSGDLKLLKQQYKEIRRNRNRFMDTLVTALDLATVLPVCENEYAEHIEKFCVFESIYDLLRCICEIFESYNMHVVISPLLADRICGAGGMDARENRFADNRKKADFGG